MIYKELVYCGKDKAIAKLSSPLTIEEIGDLLIAMSFNEPDLNFALGVITKFCYDENIELQGLAILCLSHLAKFHDDIPIKKVAAIFSDVINSARVNDNTLQSRISDSLNDFYLFCRPVFELIKKQHLDYLRKIDLGIEL